MFFPKSAGGRRVLYFGDLDPQGLRIPRAASKVATRGGLPPVEPDLWSYSHLLTVGQQSQLGDVNDATEVEMDWIGSLAPKVREVFNRGFRIAQEGINWEWLRQQNR